MNDERKAINDYWKGRADLAPMRRLIEERGHDPGSVPPAVLASFDQLHVGQNSGTKRFLDWVAPVKGDKVLDLGAGLGGTSRVLAADFGCRAMAVDGSPELTDSAQELTRWTGLTERVSHRCGDISQLESGGEYDIVLLQHVDMQVSDKESLYRAAAGNLGRSARVVWHDWLAGHQGSPNYPVPWSTDGSLSFPTPAAGFEEALERAGLELTRFEEMARPTVDWLTATIYKMDTFLGRRQSSSTRRFRQVEGQRIAHARLRDNVQEGRLLPFFGEAAVKL
jgi:sarcosine/dimethylglycine N-methyltransferase